MEADLLSPSHCFIELTISHIRSPTHLKVLLDEIPSFAQALHDGFVPQDVLLAQMFPSLPGFEHQAVHRVKVGQKVSHALLEVEATVL